MTLTLPVIDNADRVFFLVPEWKTDIMRRLLDTENLTTDLPAARVDPPADALFHGFRPMMRMPSGRLILAVSVFCRFFSSRAGEEQRSRRTQDERHPGDEFRLVPRCGQVRGAFGDTQRRAWRVRVFPHAQLAGGAAHRTRNGAVRVIDCSLESTILLSLIDPRMSVPSLPWLFPDYTSARAALDGPLGRELLNGLEEKGMVGLACGANGFRQITNSRGPIRTPDDLRDLKVRVPAIRMYIEIFKLLGADPSAMNFGELFTALAQGTMDGQENPVTVIHASRMWEVQKYLTLWNYSYDPIVLCVNRRLWFSLDQPDRALFSECAREAMDYEFGLVVNGEQAALDSLRAKGMTVNALDPVAVERFRALAEPIYRAYEPSIGADLIRRFRATAKGDSLS